VPMPGGLRPASFQRVRRVWRDLAEAPGAFQRPGCTVAPRGSAEEAGRISVVQLGDATAVVVPPAMVRRFSDLVASQPGCDLTDPVSVVNLVGPVARFLGPASLAYADDACFQPRGVQGITTVPAGDNAVRGLVNVAGPDWRAHAPAVARSGLGDRRR
jgi:hypothetical protein